MQNLDVAVFRIINHGLANGPTDVIASILTCLGVGIMPVGAGLIVALIGYISYSAKLCTTGYSVIVSSVLGGILSQIGKHLWDRPRPVMVLHDARWVGEPLYVHSFPSGHTATAFAAAVVVGAYYPKLRLPVYLLAAAVGFTRIYLGAHFLSDVLAGAAFGIAAGFLTLLMFKPRRSIVSPAHAEETAVEN